MRWFVKVVLVAAAALIAAVPTAYATFVNDQREVVIGAHDAQVTPTFDGWAELDFGAVLPRLRLPADGPLGTGVTIRLGDADVSSLDELVARDAVIASQPEGEIRAVELAVRSMARDAAARAAGVGLLTAVGVVAVWRAVGSRRRRELLQLARRPGWRRTATGLSGVVVLVAAAGLVSLPERPEADDTEWTALRSVFPDIPANPTLDTVEIADSATTAGSQALVEGALKTYQDSLDFYGDLAVTAADAEVRAPEEGEITALVVTDRHDNISMDPVARAIGDAAETSLVINLGDDTSTGSSWEAFSLNSLAEEFDDVPIVAVAGNHDEGPFFREQMDDKGFIVLDGEPVDVEGIRFLGSSDPRSSGLTAGYSGSSDDNSAAIAEQDAALTEVACEDGEVSVVAVHSAASARSLTASGCVDLVLSGHLHRQVGPEVQTGANGRLTTSLTTASTGGAVYAFALGSKLRRLAQVTVVTFRDGVPVGLQPVSFQPGGIVEVAEYVEIETSPRDDSDADDSGAAGEE